ncbi:MAG: chemotaxis protein CheB [Gemmatimonadetes bacterium]|jgi:two-component system chemotaxis response regulator CheB|nr:chemotaxis protein CheB [Gemmatimonadota bacterium]
MISLDAAKHSPRDDTPRRDVIVVGGSAGAIEALKATLAGLPKDLAAAVLVVVHIAPASPARLAEILQRGCALPVRSASGDEPLETGRVYVAPPDRHLIVEAGRVRLTGAPRENHSRPAIDPLFRSAALVYGPRVIGVVVSGRLDDGTAGLWAVKERGGIAIVQDPDDAAHPDMPRNALQYTVADHIVRAVDMGPLLARLVGERVPMNAGAVPRALELEVKIAMEANALEQGVMTLGPPTPYTCPECHGVLARMEQGGIPRFRCHTGHAYSLDSLLVSVTEKAEEALWNALRAVEETVILLNEVGAGHPLTDPRRNGAPEDPRFLERAREAQERANLIRQAVLRHQALSLESIRGSRASISASPATSPLAPPMPPPRT